MKKLSVTAMVLFVVFIVASPAALAFPGQHGNMKAGELDSDETADLLFIREEEKLARDTYLTLYAEWNDPVFQQIAQSEQRHMGQMLRMLNLYAIEDPVTDNSVGAFSRQDFTDLYEELVEKGQKSLQQALEAGAWIEELDIIDLRAAIAYTDEPALTGSYTNLLAGARMHLRAFVSRLEAMGVEYEARFLDQDDLNEMLNGFEYRHYGSKSSRLRHDRDKRCDKKQCMGN